MSRLTLEELIERKRQSDDDKVKYKAVHSDLLGGEIMVKKLPLRQVTALIDRYPNPNTTESMEMAQELIYRSCDLFRNADLQKEYGIELKAISMRSCLLFSMTIWKNSRR